LLRHAPCSVEPSKRKTAVFRKLLALQTELRLAHGKGKIGRRPRNGGRRLFDVRVAAINPKQELAHFGWRPVDRRELEKNCVP